MGTDLRPFIKRLQVIDKFNSVTTLGQTMTSYPMQERILESVQEDLDAGKPVRKRILKARQMGCSTIVQAIMFSMAFLRDNTTGLVVSHEQRSSEHLLNINRFYWNTFYAKSAFTMKSNAANKLAWDETGSRLTITTAASLGSARSQTIQFCHASEVAFWKDPATLLTGLNQAIPRVPNSMFFQETTANGVGNWFHKAWKAAKEGDDDFDALFFGWWEHPEYVASWLGKPELKTQRFFPQNDEERVLVKFLRKQGMDNTEIKDRMHWRRIFIATEAMGDLEKFHQEYPTTDEEAFISTGTNIFRIEHLRAAYEPMFGTPGELILQGGKPRFIPKDRGPLTIYAKPDHSLHHNRYVIGADPSFADKGDYACAQVLNINTAEQVATLRLKIDPRTFGRELFALGRYYNDAVMAVEGTKAGGATIGVLSGLQYPNIWIHRKTGNVKGQLDNSYGFATNDHTKREAIGLLQGALYDRWLYRDRTDSGITIHDVPTYEEMKGYVELTMGKYGNSTGVEHDDTVMAMCIANYAMITEFGVQTTTGGHATPEPESYDGAMYDVFRNQGVEEVPVYEGMQQVMEAGDSPWLDETSGQEDMYEESEW